ncbi:aminopeptidase [Azomonas macrocytogenes]|nr:aminopeptidase [Azomonas macrocytogenes]
MRHIFVLLYHLLLRRIFLLSVLLLSGCASYYGQLASGQLSLLQSRQSIDTLIGDPGQDAELRQRLALLLKARAFASSNLGLPDNASYRQYADIQRSYVVWNVFATPEFSVEPLQHCFPIAGCVAYRGYFHQSAARATAAELSLTGLDTLVAGVDAYSTLGWFADPVLSSMLRRNDEQLAALVFHELAHQRLYLPGDTAFNESYASFVEQEGLREWQALRGLPPPRAERERAYRQLVELVLATRERLRVLYASGQPEAIMRTNKQAEFMRLRQAYHRLRERDWKGQGYFDHWINQPLNNATLLPFGLYDGWTPAFARLFEQSGRNWPEFHAAVEKLAQLTDSERNRQLQALMTEQGQQTQTAGT